MVTPSIPPELVPYFTGEKTDNSSLQSEVIKLNSVLMTFVVATVGLRFWVRLRMLRCAGPDDILLLIAVVFSILLSTSALVGETFGLGNHLWHLGDGSLTSLLSSVSKLVKSLYGCYLAYTTSITFTKLSIIWTYVRFFPKGLARNVNFGLGIAIFLFWVSSIFAIIFQCVPAHSAWNYGITGKCYPIKNFFFSLSAFNLITDILLCILPIPLLWSLKMPRAQRGVLCFLFCMGIFASIASILRIAHLDHSSSWSSLDISYNTVEPLNWSIIEANVGIICVALSALRPLVKRLIPKFFLQTSRASNPNAYESLQTTTMSAFMSKDLQINSIIQLPPLTRDSSIMSTRSEFSIQRSVEVKELPPMPIAVEQLPPVLSTIQLPVIPPIVFQREYEGPRTMSIFMADFWDTTLREDRNESIVQDSLSMENDIVSGGDMPREDEKALDDDTSTVTSLGFNRQES